MGAVFIGEHTVLRRTAAVKLLHGFLTKNVQITQRFINEALAASILESEHIVKVLDCQQDPRTGLWWIALEHLHGQTLAKYLAAQGRPLALDIATKIACQIAEALDEAHANGIIHRDIKPDNIFLTERGGNSTFVKVLDFGIAKLRREDAGLVTKTNTVLGTQPFMPPEQLRGWPIDNRVDVYALTVVVYLKFSNGHHPFQAGETLEQFYQLTSAELCIRQLNQSPSDIRRWNSSIPEAVARVLERGLHRDREQRPRSAGDLVVELARAAGTLDIVEQHSKLLAPNAARRSIQVPVQEAPVDPAPQERATVRLQPSAQPLPSTAPEPVAAPAKKTTTFGNAAGEVQSRRSGAKILGAILTAAAVAVIAGFAVWFAVRHVTDGAGTGGSEVATNAANGSVSSALPSDAAMAPGARADAPPAVPPPPQVADAGVSDAPPPIDAPAAVVVDARADAGVRRPSSQRTNATDSQRPGMLTVKAKPFADIEIDGKPAGSTPKTIVLSPGYHTVKLTGKPGQVKTRSVKIISDQEFTITHTWTEP